ncbi:MAG: hypothetical protein WD448_03810 [Woeseia sp.]
MTDKGLIRCQVLATVSLALLALSPLAAAQVIREIEIVDPRSFGYVIGDRIRREVALVVHSDYQLDVSSFPAPGRLDRWLEVSPPEIRVQTSGSDRRYSMVLTYQLFNVPPAQETITVPQQNLRLVAATDAVTTLVPALRVTVAPVTAMETAVISDSSLQPDRAPAAISLRARQERLAWTGAVLLLLLAFAAGRRAFAARGERPFARARRELKQLQPAPGAPRQFAAELKVVHDAVNRTAGRAVFAHNLDDFLLTHPHFAGLRADFDRLFAASSRVFFASAPAAHPEIERPFLLQLCRRGSRLERRAQRRPHPEKAIAAGA